LRAEGLGLMSAAIQRATVRSFLKRTLVGRDALASWCEQLAALISAGIRLDEALLLTRKTTKNLYVKALAIDCAHAVRQGIALSKALEYHIPGVDPLMIVLLQAGEESGAMSHTFRLLQAHYQTQEKLLQKLRSSLAMPCVTFLFI